jgi:hypothetical protein
MGEPLSRAILSGHYSFPFGCRIRGFEPCSQCGSACINSDSVGPVARTRLPHSEGIGLKVGWDPSFSTAYFSHVRVRSPPTLDPADFSGRSADLKNRQSQISIDGVNVTCRCAASSAIQQYLRPGCISCFELRSFRHEAQCYVAP